MATAIIFGGSGYIGKWTWKRLQSQFSKIILADLRGPEDALPKSVQFTRCDVRNPIDLNHAVKSAQMSDIDWIFNYAALHREPGHEDEEYFETNLSCAEHVTAFAEKWRVSKIFFMSSIAVYGPTRAATSESSPLLPNSAYGKSKLNAERIHEDWVNAHPTRRLVICRPGVVYGSGDPGNILRMIHAIQRGMFAYPGHPDIHKSYAYIEGLLDSLEFTIRRSERLIRYNYVETPTETLSALITHICDLLDKRKPVLSIPKWILLPLARIIQVVTRGRSAIHPRRVEKAGMDTHIIPQWLIEHGFPFQYTFRTSLEDWKNKSPGDFQI